MDAYGIGRSLKPGRRPAVVVVDLSRGFTDPASPLGADLTEAVEATRSVIDVARQRGFPVIFTTIAFEQGVGDGELWREKVPALRELLSGSRWVELDPRLGRRSDEVVIIKHGASAFFGTSLASELIAAQVDTVVLCGATTSGCVRATAVDLLQYGWRALIARECVGDRAEGAHEVSLRDIQTKYGEVLSRDQVIAYLQKELSSGEDRLPADTGMG